MLLSKKLLFLSFLLLLIVDRVFTLFHFGFVYTDIDQIMLWEGALDYASGNFYEPCFYGQNYNYMLESLLAVPLIWLNVPVHYALPIITTFLAVFPFIVLSVFLFKRQHYFWSYLSLTFLLLLPLEGNFLFTIPRGFLQAGLFIPLMFPALFNPKEKKSVYLFFVGAGLSFIANSSAAIVVFPIGVYLFSFHFRSTWFYVSALLVAPMLLFEFFVKQFYSNDLERHYYELKGIDLQISTFLKSAVNPEMFQFVFPFLKNGGILLLPILVAFSIYLRKKKKNKGLIFVAATICILLITWAIPKVSEVYETAGLFYSPSRLYMNIPLLFLLCLFFGFRHLNIKNRVPFLVLITIVILTVGMKMYKMDDKAIEVLTDNKFPIENVSDLISRVMPIDSIAKKYNVDFMVTEPLMGWPFAFEGFGYRTIMQSVEGIEPKMISVFHSGDRRVWHYDDSIIHSNILLYMMNVDKKLPETVDHKKVGLGLQLIENNTLPTKELFKKLDLPFNLPVE